MTEMVVILTVGAFVMASMSTLFDRVTDARLDWRDSLDIASDRAISVLRHSASRAETQTVCADADARQSTESNWPVRLCEQIESIGAGIWKPPDLPLADDQGTLLAEADRDEALEKMGWSGSYCVAVYQPGSAEPAAEFFPDPRALECWWHEPGYVDSSDPNAVLSSDDRGCPDVRIVRIHAREQTNDMLHPEFRFNADTTPTPSLRPEDIKIQYDKQIDADGWGCTRWVCTADTTSPKTDRCPQIVDVTGGQYARIEKLEWGCPDADDPLGWADCPDFGPLPDEALYPRAGENFSPAGRVRLSILAACPPKWELDVEECRPLAEREAARAAAAINNQPFLLFPGEHRERIVTLKLGR